MKFFEITIITIIQVSICYGLLRDYRENSSCTTSQTVKECSAGGPLCESCTSLVFCTRADNGNWTKTQVETCKAGLSCVQGKCSNETNPLCDGTACVKFECAQTGIFPDPFFWDKYVMCVNIGTPTTPKLKAYSTDCDAGFYYNVANGLCDQKAKGQGYPVPKCASAGQSAPLDGNKAIYYICEIVEETNELYPRLQRCPGADLYDKDTYECKAPGDS